MDENASHISHLFSGYEFLRPKKGAGRGGVHGDMLRYFCTKLNPGRVQKGYKPLTERGVQKVLGTLNTTRDLFWLKSICDDAESRGFSWSKRFWYYAKLQTHVEDLPIEQQGCPQSTGSVIP
jgi:hypothetical protein